MAAIGRSSDLGSSPAMGPSVTHQSLWTQLPSWHRVEELNYLDPTLPPYLYMVPSCLKLKF